MKKKLGLILSLLMCVSVIGVGFAAWIITTGSSDDAEGNITVDAVSTKIVTVTAEMTDASIHFGAPASKDEEVTNNWLLNDAMGLEDLSYTVKVTIENYNQLTGLTFGFTVVDNENETTNADKYQSVLDANLIVAPNVSDSNVVVDENYDFAANGWNISGTTASKDFTFTYAWGTVFGKKNPINFYNEYAYGDYMSETDTTLVEDHASTNLGYLAAINNISYKLTITATA